MGEADVNQISGMHNFKLKESEQLYETIGKGTWLSLKQGGEGSLTFSISWELKEEWVGLI